MPSLDTLISRGTEGSRDHTERLATLSRMVAAAASDGDRDRCSTVAHRYLAALVDHLSCCGPATWDGDAGLVYATQQLLVLNTARRVIASTFGGAPDVQ